MPSVWQSEDSLVEKKLESDLQDLLKTLVAFANSVAPGDTAKILIGERDDGTVQGVKNTDNIQKSVKSYADKIYPEIFYKTQVYERDDKQCVSVSIQSNGLAPHFGGKAWIRRGSVTEVATEEVFQQLIDLRSDKVRELSRWLRKRVIVSWARKSPSLIGPNWDAIPCELVEVNRYFSTFRNLNSAHQRVESEPNNWLELSWDNGQNCPLIYVNPEMKTRPPW
jgi:hypothetical protein